MRGQRFLDINEAIKSRRSERMLAAFGLTSMTEEKIRRERSRLDDRPCFFTLAQRQDLFVLAARWKDQAASKWDRAEGGDDQC